MTLILLIDNFDSFTYNIYQSFSEEDIEVKVVRNNAVSIEEIEQLNPEAIIISPGPGLPEQTGICMEVVKRFYKEIPVLGISLGHHIIAAAFGAKRTEVETIKHGKTTLITHNGFGMFSYLSQPLEVMLYHSHVIDEKTMPFQLEVMATSLDSGEIMAIKHKNYPLYGLQFHPESIGTRTGKKIIQNFLLEIRKGQTHEAIS